MAEVTVITNDNSAWTDTGSAIFWSVATNWLNLGNSLSSDADNRYLRFIEFLYTGGSAGRIRLRLSDSPTTDTGQDDLSDQMEMSGSITFTATNGDSVTVTGIGDASEPYQWTPSNSADVVVFANTLRGLADRTLIILFNDNFNQPPVISNLVANPMIVASGGDIALTADVTDPNMDMVSYSWRANPDLGTFADASAKDTTWTAPTSSFDRSVMLTLTASDPLESSTASVGVIVQGTPRVVIPSPYCVLVDVNNDGGYALDIYPGAAALTFSAGASGARREGIAAKAGILRCRLNNSNGFYQRTDLENKPIRVRRNGLYLWGGVIDDVQDKALRGTRRELIISALGRMTAIGGNVQFDISESGDIPASQAVGELTGVTGIELTTQEVNDWSVDAGDDILQELRAIQDSSGTRVYEDLQGDLQLAGQGVTDLLDVTLADDGALAGDRRSRWMRRETPNSSIINAVVIDGTKYTDSDSVDEYGEILHPSDFEFAVAAEADTIAADIFSLYAEPPSLYKASYLLENLVGATNQNDLLSRLFYGNESLLSVRFEGDVELAEIIHAKHNVMRGERHIIELMLRGRSSTGIDLTLNTYWERDVGYFAQLPPTSADGARIITGHKIQYREAGTQAWTDAVSSETGLAVNDTFTVPTANEEYDVRLVAISASGDEQTTPTETLRALAVEPRYQQGTAGTLPRLYNNRNYRLYTDKILSGATSLRIIGFDWQSRQATWPEGWVAGFYASRSGYAAPRGEPGTAQANANFNNYAVPITQTITYSANLLSTLPFQQPISTILPASVDGGAQLRFRPIFHAAGATLDDGERGLWTPWLTTSDITVTY